MKLSGGPEKKLGFQGTVLCKIDQTIGSRFGGIGPVLLSFLGAGALAPGGHGSVVRIGIE